MTQAELEITYPPELPVTQRRDDIAAAIREAGPQDIVLIAGKGHETGQTVGDRVLPFDDVQVAPGHFFGSDTHLRIGFAGDSFDPAQGCRLIAARLAEAPPRAGSGDVLG